MCKCALNIGLVALTLFVPACGRGASDAAQYEASPRARRFEITGIVRGITANGQLTVAHEAIPGLMDAMTMSFPVRDAWATRVAAPGDRLTGTLVVDDARSWLEQVSLTKPPEGAGATPGAAAIADVVGPPPGTPLPDAPLRDQAGRVVTARDFAGRDVVLTFIYTRCPLPDYCPRMMSRLNEAAERLRKAGRREDVQMVAISIDPAHDSPKVLADYGRRFIKGEDDPFRRWSLLTGTPENVSTWARLFALTYEQDGSDIAHGLRTAVVDREGKVVGVLRGNDWTTDQLMQLLSSS